MFSLFRAPDRTKAILDRYLDAQFYCAAAHDSAPSVRQMKELGARLGCKFPKEFIAHSCGPLGGIYVEVKEEFWPRPQLYEVGQFWTFLYGLYVYGYSANIPAWMNIELAAHEFREKTGHQHVPCLKVVGDANVYAFTPEGELVQWDHETDEFSQIGEGFFAILEDEVRELRERKDRKMGAT